MAGLNPARERDMASKEDWLVELGQAVLDGDEERASGAAVRALKAGLSPLEAIDSGLVPGIQKAGRFWDEGEYFLPELVASAQAMKAAMAILQPALSGARSTKAAVKVVIGTVQGDIHDIGKTLVATLLSANGFEVFDEGADVPLSRFIQRAKEVDADLLCASALLTTTMSLQRDLVLAAREAGLKAKVCVGGAPVTNEWAKAIGADGFADNAVAAVALARSLVGHGA
jgi:corrinoid protein of di/trimethylamine methyltransferase